MHLLLIGLNHETASIDIREKVAFSADQLPEAIGQIRQNALADETVILSTCNRMELVFYQAAWLDTKSIVAWLHGFFDLEVGELDYCLYQYQDQEAVSHIMRVAGGLNSLVLGEPQILGQVKDAYQLAKSHGGLRSSGSQLNGLYQCVFQSAKQVRSDTAIGANPVSVAFAAVNMAKLIFDDFHPLTALVLGAGQTIELVCQHLVEQGIGRLLIANRTLSTAQQLAKKLNTHIPVDVVELTHIRSVLDQADMVIASTASPIPVLGKGQMESAMNKRRNQQMLLVDIAVPRDIEPEIADLSNVFLYTVDDLKSIIEDNKRSREQAAHEAEQIIQDFSQSFMQRQQSQHLAVPLIQQYRQGAEDVKQQLIGKALQSLRQGTDAEQVVARLANQLAQKLIHHPTLAIRHAADEGDVDKVRWLANQLNEHRR